MATPVLMPKQGQSVETCIITKWFKNKGDKVAAGEMLFSYETDKAAFELESPDDGILLDIFFGEGAEVPVLVNVAVIGRQDESVSEFQPGTSKAGATVAQESIALKPAATESNVISDQSAQTGQEIKISPRAKKLAELKGFNYSSLQGTGPNGRIISADIEKALAAGIPSSEYAAGTEFSESPLSNVRRLISKAMHDSLQNSAQLTHHMSADVRRLLDARKKIKENVASGQLKQDITLNDMICWCVIRALEKFPEANSHFLGNSIKTWHTVNLGIAVDTQRGLMVPAVKNAGKMELSRLSAELKSIADACRKGNISPELIKAESASFTVSNLGNYGVEMFTPVINLPQVAILGVCTIIYRPADMGNNTFGFVPYIGLSLTYDHRAIDGGPATLFLREIKDQIERFEYK